MIQKTALYFGTLNLVIGLSGFFGPFVTGNDEDLINIETGQLFSVLAINWAHALVFVAFGLYGISARKSKESASTYFWSVGVLFGLLALLGLLGQVGLLEVRGPEGTLTVLEIAVDTLGIGIHAVWALIGAGLAYRAHTMMAESQHRIVHA